MANADRREELRAQFEATNAKIEAKAGRNLFFAVGSAVAFGAVFLGSLLFVKELFVLLVLAIVTIALVELASAFRFAGRRVPRVGVVLGGALIVAGSYFLGAEGMLLGLFAASVGLTAWRLLEGVLAQAKPERNSLVRDVFSGLFTLVYVAFLASFNVLLCAAPGGEFWVLSLIVIVAAVDIGAYAFGVTLGKHKMTPRISPNKTWEGFAGAALVATTVATLMAIFVLHQPWWVGVVFGLLVLLTATGGDLTESLIKRNLGVKDMSTWLPGHGGFLDRIDSILPSSVVAYGLALTLGVLS